MTKNSFRYIPVDVYGKCGEFSCAVASSSSVSSDNDIDSSRNSDGGWDCFGTAQRKYKFLLAFEDAVCKDYVTETFFSPFNDDDANNVVPVVLGGANYSALGAPPHSYIDSADFKGPKQLAHFLKLLDADDAR